jgi:RNA polymerase sigma factor (sigma-70 family)
MAAVPSTRRATEVEREPAPEADAARALYERYAGQLYGFCLHRLGSREDAEDAVQTTFLNAFRGLRRGVVPEVESAWLFKIAENVCLTRHRSAWRRGRVESPSDMQALQDITPAREADGGDELIPLGEALAAMPETQRRAILLREWQGLSYKEIAAELEMTQSAVETLIFRARRSLANALETPWQERRAAGQGGRRAFDLASLLAGLKTLFAGAGAAKVAAVAAVAVTGTAALAVADRQHQAPPVRVEPSAGAARAPDSAARRPLVSSLGGVSTTGPSLRGGPATERTGPAAAKSRADSREAREEASSAASTPGAEKVPPGQAKEPGTPASSRARANRPEATPRHESRPAPKKSKPKVAAPKSKSRPAAKQTPRADEAKPEPAKAGAAPSPPPPAQPSEKDKEKDSDD